ncbi:uroporphyrinogen decarboxylase family protein [Verrucomicrobiota bacterium]
MAAKYESINREEVKKAIEGRGSVRPPAYMHKWPGEGLREYHGDRLDEVFSQYPDDIVPANVMQPGGWEAPEGYPAEYRFAVRDRQQQDETGPRGHDSGSMILSDWADLDAFLETLPRADDPKIYEYVRQAVDKAGGRYVIVWAWNYFYERLWGLRGMENILMDFHLHPREMHRLCEGLLDLVLQFVKGAADAGADGFATSNDLGHQTSLMMSPESFREFLKPLHAKVAAACHERGMHYWTHSCGNLTEIVEDFVEVGLDCLHPLQYGAMDWKEVAPVLKGRMTAWAGIDVQHILQEATPDGVRAHVRELIDTFHEPGAGRCIVAAGNGITGSTPLENIDAFLDETYRYGLSVAGRG